MMSRLLWMCIVILLALPKPIAAQSEGWATGCGSQAEPMIAATTQLNYGEACTAYETCTDAGGSIGVCQMRGFIILQAGCTDAHCETEAALYAATMTVFSDLSYFVMWRGEEVQLQVTAAVMQGLESFQAGGYEAAADAFNAVSTDDYLHPMLPLSAGLAYEAAGETDEALAQYNAAIQTSYFQPLSYYLRGNVLADIGSHAEEAAIDFSLLAQYTADDEQASSFVKAFVEEHPIDSDFFEAWAAYPVISRSLGVGGEWLNDESQAESRTLMLARFDGDKKLAAQNLSQLLTQQYNYFPETLVLDQRETDVYRFRVSYVDDYGTWGGSITVDLSQNPVQVTEDDLQFESNSNTAFVIAPANEPDPRLAFAGEHCPGAALSRLKIGARGHALETMQGPRVLFDAIDGEQTGTVGTFTVMSGPECRDNRAWWQITLDDGTTGWAIESEGTVYQLFPESNSLIPPLKDGT